MALTSTSYITAFLARDMFGEDDPESTEVKERTIVVSRRRVFLAYGLFFSVFCAAIAALWIAGFDVESARYLDVPPDLEVLQIKDCYVAYRHTAPTDSEINALGFGRMTTQSVDGKTKLSTQMIDGSYTRNCFFLISIAHRTAPLTIQLASSTLVLEGHPSTANATLPFSLHIRDMDIGNSAAIGIPPTVSRVQFRNGMIPQALDIVLDGGIVVMDLPRIGRTFNDLASSIIIQVQFGAVFLGVRGATDPFPTYAAVEAELATGGWCYDSTAVTSDPVTVSNGNRSTFGVPINPAKIQPGSLPQLSLDISATSLYILVNERGAGTTVDATALYKGSLMEIPATISDAAQASLQETQQWLTDIKKKNHVQNLAVVTPIGGALLMESDKKVFFEMRLNILNILSGFALAPARRYMSTALSHYQCNVNVTKTTPYLTRPASLISALIDEHNTDDAAFFKLASNEVLFTLLKDTERNARNFSAAHSSIAVFTRADLELANEIPVAVSFRLVNSSGRYIAVQVEMTFAEMGVIGISILLGFVVMIIAAYIILVEMYDELLVFVMFGSERQKIRCAQKLGPMEMRCGYHLYSSLYMVHSAISFAIIQRFYYWLYQFIFIQKFLDQTFERIPVVKRDDYNRKIPLADLATAYCQWSAKLYVEVTALPIKELKKAVTEEDSGDIEVSVETVPTKNVRGVSLMRANTEEAAEVLIPDVLVVTGKAFDEVPLVTIINETALQGLTDLAADKGRRILALLQKTPGVKLEDMTVECIVGLEWKRLLPKRYYNELKGDKGGDTTVEMDPTKATSSMDKAAIRWSEESFSSWVSIDALLGATCTTAPTMATVFNLREKQGWEALAWCALQRALHVGVMAVTPIACFLVTIAFNSVAGTISAIPTWPTQWLFIWPFVRIPPGKTYYGANVMVIVFYTLAFMAVSEPLVVLMFRLINKKRYVRFEFFVRNVASGLVFFSWFWSVLAVVWYIVIIFCWLILSALLSPNEMIAYATSAFALASTVTVALKALKNNREAVLDRLRKRMVDEMVEIIKSSSGTLADSAASAANSADEGKLTMAVLMDAAKGVPEALEVVAEAVNAPPAIFFAILAISRRDAKAIQAAVAEIRKLVNLPENVEPLMVTVMMRALGQSGGSDAQILRAACELLPDPRLKRAVDECQPIIASAIQSLSQDSGDMADRAADMMNSAMVIVLNQLRKWAKKELMELIEKMKVEAEARVRNEVAKAESSSDPKVRAMARGLLFLSNVSPSAITSFVEVLKAPFRTFERKDFFISIGRLVRAAKPAILQLIDEDEWLKILPANNFVQTNPMKIRDAVSIVLDLVVEFTRQINGEENDFRLIMFELADNVFSITDRVNCLKQRIRDASALARNRAKAAITTASSAATGAIDSAADAVVSESKAILDPSTVVAALAAEARGLPVLHVEAPKIEAPIHISVPNEFTNAVNSGAAAITGATSSAANAVNNAAASAANAANSAAAAGVGAVNNATAAGVSAVNSATATAVNAANSAAAQGADVINSTAAQGAAAITDATAAGAAAVNNAAAQGVSSVNNLTSEAVAATHDVTTAGVAAVSDATGAVVQTTQNVTGAAVDITNDATAAVVDTTGNVTGAAVNATNNATAAAVATTNDVTAAAVNATNDATSAAVAVTNDATRAAVDATNAATSAAVATTSDVTGAAVNATNDATAAGMAAVNDATSAGVAAVNDATTAGANAVATGVDAVNDAAATGAAAATNGAAAGVGAVGGVAAAGAGAVGAGGTVSGAASAGTAAATNAAAAGESAVNSGTAAVTDATATAVNSANTAAAQGAAAANNAAATGAAAVNNAVGDGADAVNNAVGQGAATVNNAVGQGAASVNNAVGQGAATVNNAVGEGAATVNNAVADGADAVNSAVGQGAAAVNGAVGQGADAVNGAVADGAAAVNGAVGQGAAAANNAAQQASATVNNAVGQGADAVNNAAAEAQDAVNSATAQGVEAVNDAVGQGTAAINNATADAVNTVNQVTADAANTVNTVAADAANAANNAALAGQAAVNNATAAGVSAVNNATASTVNAVNSTVNNGAASINNAAQNAADAANSAINQGVDQINDVTGQAADAVNQAAAQGRAALINAADSAGNALTSAANAANDAIEDTVEAAAEKTKAAIEDALSKAHSVIDEETARLEIQAIYVLDQVLDILKNGGAKEKVKKMMKAARSSKSGLSASADVLLGAALRLVRLSVIKTPPVLAKILRIVFEMRSTTEITAFLESDPEVGKIFMQVSAATPETAALAAAGTITIDHERFGLVATVKQLLAQVLYTTEKGFPDAKEAYKKKGKIVFNGIVKWISNVIWTVQCILEDHGDGSFPECPPELVLTDADVDQLSSLTGIPEEFFTLFDDFTVMARGMLKHAKGASLLSVVSVILSSETCNSLLPGVNGLSLVDLTARWIPPPPGADGSIPPLDASMAGERKAQKEKEKAVKKLEKQKKEAEKKKKQQPAPKMPAPRPKALDDDEDEDEEMNLLSANGKDHPHHRREGDDEEEEDEEPLAADASSDDEDDDEAQLLTTGFAVTQGLVLKDQQLAKKITAVTDKGQQLVDQMEEEMSSKKDAAVARAGELREDMEQEMADMKARAADAKRQAEQKVGELKQQAQDKMDDVKDRADALKDAAEAKIDETKQQAQEKLEEAKRRAEDMKDAAEEKVDELKNKAQDAVNDAKQQAEDMKQAAQDKVDELKDQAQDKIDDVKQQALDMKQQAEDKVDDLKQTAKDKVSELKSKALDSVPGLKMLSGLSESPEIGLLLRMVLKRPIPADLAPLLPPARRPEKGDEGASNVRAILRSIKSLRQKVETDMGSLLLYTVLGDDKNATEVRYSMANKLMIEVAHYAAPNGDTWDLNALTKVAQTALSMREKAEKEGVDPLDLEYAVQAKNLRLVPNHLKFLADCRAALKPDHIITSYLYRLSLSKGADVPDFSTSDEGYMALLRRIKDNTSGGNAFLGDDNSGDEKNWRSPENLRPQTREWKGPLTTFEAMRQAKLGTQPTNLNASISMNNSPPQTSLPLPPSASASASAGGGAAAAAADDGKKRKVPKIVYHDPAADRRIGDLDAVLFCSQCRPHGACRKVRLYRSLVAVMNEIFLTDDPPAPLRRTVDLPQEDIDKMRADPKFKDELKAAKKALNKYFLLFVDMIRTSTPILWKAIANTEGIELGLALEMMEGKYESPAEMRWWILRLIESFLEDAGIAKVWDPWEDGCAEEEEEEAAAAEFVAIQMPTDDGAAPAAVSSATAVAPAAAKTTTKAPTQKQKQLDEKQAEKKRIEAKYGHMKNQRHLRLLPDFEALCENFFRPVPKTNKNGEVLQYVFDTGDPFALLMNKMKFWPGGQARPKLGDKAAAAKAAVPDIRSEISIEAIEFFARCHGLEYPPAPLADRLPHPEKGTAAPPAYQAFCTFLARRSNTPISAMARLISVLPVAVRRLATDLSRFRFSGFYRALPALSQQMDAITEHVGGDVAPGFVHTLCTTLQGAVTGEDIANIFYDQDDPMNVVLSGDMELPWLPPNLRFAFRNMPYLTDNKKNVEKAGKMSLNPLDMVKLGNKEEDEENEEEMADEEMDESASFAYTVMYMTKKEKRKMYLAAKAQRVISLTKVIISGDVLPLLACLSPRISPGQAKDSSTRLRLHFRMFKCMALMQALIANDSITRFTMPKDPEAAFGLAGFNGLRSALASKMDPIRELMKHSSAWLLPKLGGKGGADGLPKEIQVSEEMAATHTLARLRRSSARSCSYVAFALIHAVDAVARELDLHGTRLVRDVQMGIAPLRFFFNDEQQSLIDFAIAFMTRDPAKVNNTLSRLAGLLNNLAPDLIPRQLTDLLVAIISSIFEIWVQSAKSDTEVGGKGRGGAGGPAGSASGTVSAPGSDAEDALKEHVKNLGRYALKPMLSLAEFLEQSKRPGVEEHHLISKRAGKIIVTVSEMGSPNAEQAMQLSTAFLEFMMLILNGDVPAPLDIQGVADAVVLGRPPQAAEALHMLYSLIYIVESERKKMMGVNPHRALELAVALAPRLLQLVKAPEPIIRMITGAANAAKDGNLEAHLKEQMNAGLAQAQRMAADKVNQQLGGVNDHINAQLGAINSDLGVNEKLAAVGISANVNPLNGARVNLHVADSAEGVAQQVQGLAAQARDTVQRAENAAAEAERMGQRVVARAEATYAQAERMAEAKIAEAEAKAAMLEQKFDNGKKMLTTEFARRKKEAVAAKNKLLGWIQEMQKFPPEERAMRCGLAAVEALPMIANTLADAADALGDSDDDLADSIPVLQVPTAAAAAGVPPGVVPGHVAEKVGAAAASANAEVAAAAGKADDVRKTIRRELKRAAAAIPTNLVPILTNLFEISRGNFDVAVPQLLALTGQEMPVRELAQLQRVLKVIKKMAGDKKLASVALDSAKQMATDAALNALTDFIYTEFDPTNSGALSFNAFRTILVRMRLSMPLQEQRALFQKADKDGSGFVSKDEFADILVDLRMLLQNEIMKQIGLTKENITMAIIFLAVLLVMLLTFVLLGCIVLAGTNDFEAGIAGILPLGTTQLSKLGAGGMSFERVIATAEAAAQTVLKKMKGMV